MKEKYSHRNGRLEAVMWIVYMDDKVIVEMRPEYEKGESMCIPCGHIDINRDKTVEEAFLRESQEEFAEGKFKPIKYEFLASIEYDEKTDSGVEKLLLHYFVVTGWDGAVPFYTVEHGNKHADLVWIPLKKYKVLPQSCDREALKKLIRRL